MNIQSKLEFIWVWFPPYIFLFFWSEVETCLLLEKSIDYQNLITHVGPAQGSQKICTSNLMFLSNRVNPTEFIKKLREASLKYVYIQAEWIFIIFRPIFLILFLLKNMELVLLESLQLNLARTLSMVTYGDCLHWKVPTLKQIID